MNIHLAISILRLKRNDLMAGSLYFRFSYIGVMKHFTRGNHENTITYLGTLATLINQFPFYEAHLQNDVKKSINLTKRTFTLIAYVQRDGTATL